MFCRFFRRYWTLNSIPGLFVEEFPDDALTSDVLSVKVQQKGKSSGDNKTVTATNVAKKSTETTTDNVPCIDLTESADEESVSANQTNGGLSPHIRTKMSKCNTSSHSNDETNNSASDATEILHHSSGTQGRNYRYGDLSYIVLSPTCIYFPIPLLCDNPTHFLKVGQSSMSV